MSKARVLLPEPESPVKTTSSFFGIDRFIFFRLCSFAPVIFINSLIFYLFLLFFALKILLKIPNYSKNLAIM